MHSRTPRHPRMQAAHGRKRRPESIAGREVEPIEFRRGVASVKSAAVDKFIARENVKHLRESSRRKWIPRHDRSSTLLVAEEDKLGVDFELLADLDQHVGANHERIARQTALVATMERDGHVGLGQAKALLACLTDSHDLHEGYRQRVLIRINQNRL